MGHQFKGNAKFCSGCGAPINLGFAPSGTQRPWRRKGPLFWTGIGFASLVGLIFVLLTVAVVVAAIEDLSGQRTSNITEVVDDTSDQGNIDQLTSLTAGNLTESVILEQDATLAPTPRPEALSIPNPKLETKPIPTTAPKMTSILTLRPELAIAQTPALEVTPTPTPVPVLVSTPSTKSVPPAAPTAMAEAKHTPPPLVSPDEVSLRSVGQSGSSSTMIYIRANDGARFEEVSYRFDGNGPGRTEDFAARDGMLCMYIRVNPDTGPYEFWLKRNEGSIAHGRLVQEFRSRATGSNSCVTIYYPNEDKAGRDESFVGTVRGQPVFLGDRIVDGFFKKAAGTYHLEVNAKSNAPWEIQMCTKEPLKEGFRFRPECNEPSVGEPLEEHSELVHLSIGQLWYLTVNDYQAYCGIIRDDYWHVINEHDSSTIAFVSQAAIELGLSTSEVANRLTMC